MTPFFFRSLYRYSDHPREKHAETPVDEHNHALGALRYLVSRIDSHKMAHAAPQRKTAAIMQEPPRPPKSWLRYDNEALWTTL